MTYLNVRVTRIWDPDWYPGFAECALVDASGAEHRFQDKIPVFSARTLTLDDLPWFAASGPGGTRTAP